MTNLIASTFLYLTALESGELKTSHGVRMEWIAPNGWGAGAQANSHPNDSVFDGSDSYVIRQWTWKRFKPGVFAGIGQNWEDERFRTTAGVRLDLVVSRRFTLELSAAGQREYGSWKGDREPIRAVMTIGGGWRF